MKFPLVGAFLLALFTLSAVTPASAAPTLSIDRPLQTVLQSLQQNDKLPVIALMRDCIPLNELSRAVEGLTRTQRKQVVWEMLQEHADKNQRDLLGFLDKQALEGQVLDINSITLINGISFNATAEIIEQVASRSDVRLVLYDEKSCLLPDQPENSELSLDELDELAWGVEHINAPAVWDQGYTGEGVLVAVIDTGVNYNHTDLASHLWDGGEAYPNHGYDFANSDNDPIDDNGHGSHCAGTVLGDGTSGTETGVAPGATLMCLKALDYNGFAIISHSLSAFDFALEHAVDVISMSVGWTSLTSSSRSTFRQAFDTLNEAGVISAIAAGNERDWPPQVPYNVRTPGDIPSPWRSPDEVETGARGGVITIGATTAGDFYADFSSEGPATWADVSPFNDYPYSGTSVGLIKPDVCAPGVSITSLDYDDNDGYVGGVDWSGTSMATPHVAGVIALMLCKYSNLTPVEVDSILQTTSLDLGATGKDNDYGAGRIQANEAVDAVVGITGTVQGYVVDENTDEPIEAVTLSFVQRGGTAVSNESGAYSVELQIGTYTLLINHPPYAPLQMSGIIVEEDQATRVDVSLRTGILETDPSSLSFSADGQTRALTLQNSGSTDLDVHIKLSPSLEDIEWLDSLFEVSATSVTTDSRLRGLKYVDGFYYIAGSNNLDNPNNIYVLDESGEQVRSFVQPGSDQPDASSIGMYDLAYDGTNLWGSDRRSIISFNAESGEEVSRFDGPYNPNRALAYDPVHDCLWVGESLQDIVAVNPVTGEEIVTIESDLRIQAFEYVPDDDDGMNLYLACIDQASRRAFYKMNTETYEIVKVGDLPDVAERDIFGLTWVPGYSHYYVALAGLLEGSPNDVLRGWQIDATVSWAELNQIELSIEPDASINVNVTSNSEGLEESEYNAYLLLVHNGMGETQVIPMSLDLDSGVKQDDLTQLPVSYELEQPYPNPFNGMTNVRFSTPVAGDVRVAVYDLLGREVAKLHEGNLQPGHHTLSLSMGQHASGLYFIRMKSGDGFQAVRKVVLMK